MSVLVKLCVGQTHWSYVHIIFQASFVSQQDLKNGKTELDHPIKMLLYEFNKLKINPHPK
jgi:hypothetical protein